MDSAQSAALWIGYCVLWALAAVSTALPVAATMWAIDQWIAKSAIFSGFTRWMIRETPVLSALAAQGWRFWLWGDEVQSRRAMRAQVRSHEERELREAFRAGHANGMWNEWGNHWGEPDGPEPVNEDTYIQSKLNEQSRD